MTEERSKRRKLLPFIFIVVCDKNNFIWWNQRQQNARRFETTSFVASEGTAFRMLCQQCVIFRECTAGENSYF